MTVADIDQAFAGLLLLLAFILLLCIAAAIDRGLSAARRMRHWTRRGVRR